MHLARTPPGAACISDTLFPLETTQNISLIRCDPVPLPNPTSLRALTSTTRQADPTGPYVARCTTPVDIATPQYNQICSMLSSPNRSIQTNIGARRARANDATHLKMTTRPTVLLACDNASACPPAVWAAGQAQDQSAIEKQGRGWHPKNATPTPCAPLTAPRGRAAGRGRRPSRPSLVGMLQSTADFDPAAQKPPPTAGSTAASIV
jgi:hypothetical protein